MRETTIASRNRVNELWSLVFRVARTVLRAPIVHVSARWLRLRTKWFQKPPATVNEKIRVHMAFTRDPALTMMADKYAVREIVEKRVGAQYLPELLGVYERSDELVVPGVLPRRCAAKATHGSGATLLVDDSLERGTRRVPRPRPIFPWDANARIHPDDIEPEALEGLLDAWLRSDYSLLKAEWAYGAVPRRIIVEELLEAEGEPPPDYKFWCVNGTVRFFQVDEGRFARHTRSIHLPDGTLVPVTIRYPAPERSRALPSTLDEMIEVSEALADGVDFVRVDLYALGSRIVVGELTNYPEGGMARIRPKKVLSQLASDWDVM